MILTLFTKLLSVALEQPDSAKEVAYTVSTCDARTNFCVLFNEIVEAITQRMRTRFSDFVKIRFLDLSDSSKYIEYQKTFPEESF